MGLRAERHAMRNSDQQMIKEVSNGGGSRMSTELHQRVPAEALRGVYEGEGTLTEATLVCRATEGASFESAGNNGCGVARGKEAAKGGFQELDRSRKACREQERFLEEYAKAKGMWCVDADVQMRETPEFPEYFEGGETMVFIPADSAKPMTKLITSSYFPEIVQLLDRIILHNYLFPDTLLTVRGFGRTHANWADDPDRPMFCVKVEQDVVVADMPATEDQIAAHMKSLGFHEHRRLAGGDIVWVSDDGRFVVSDLTEENVLVDQCGNIRVIDANIQLNTPESDGGGAYKIP